MTLNDDLEQTFVPLEERQPSRPIFKSNLISLSCLRVALMGCATGREPCHSEHTSAQPLMAVVQVCSKTFEQGNVSYRRPTQRSRTSLRWLFFVPVCLFHLLSGLGKTCLVSQRMLNRWKATKGGTSVKESCTTRRRQVLGDARLSATDV